MARGKGKRGMRKMRKMREMREMLLAQLLGVTAAKLAMVLMGFMLPACGWISRPIASDFVVLVEKVFICFIFLLFSHVLFVSGSLL